MLGVCADSLVMFEDEEKSQSFIWPDVAKMSYKHSNFHVRILHSEVVITHLCWFKKEKPLMHYFFTYRLGKSNIPD